MGQLDMAKRVFQDALKVEPNLPEAVSALESIDIAMMPRGLVKGGRLLKRTRHGIWKKKWVELHDDGIKFWSSQKKEKPAKVIPIKGLVAGRPLGEKYRILIREAKGQSYLFAALTPEIADAWLLAITRTTQKDLMQAEDEEKSGLGKSVGKRISVAISSITTRPRASDVDPPSPSPSARPPSPPPSPPSPSSPPLSSSSKSYASPQRGPSALRISQIPAAPLTPPHAGAGRLSALPPRPESPRSRPPESPLPPRPESPLCPDSPLPQIYAESPRPQHRFFPEPVPQLEGDDDDDDDGLGFIPVQIDQLSQENPESPKSGVVGLSVSKSMGELPVMSSPSMGESVAASPSVGDLGVAGMAPSPADSLDSLESVDSAAVAPLELETAESSDALPFFEFVPAGDSPKLQAPSGGLQVPHIQSPPSPLSSSGRVKVALQFVPMPVLPSPRSKQLGPSKS